MSTLYYAYSFKFPFSSFKTAKEPCFLLLLWYSAEATGVCAVW